MPSPIDLHTEAWQSLIWPLEKRQFASRIKSVPEDFRVDEAPAYEPSGSGEFVYLRIEKCDVASDLFIRTIAERLDVPSRSIGVAGRKDRRAVTTQWVSIAASDLRNDLAAVEGPVGPNGYLRLLDTSRHTNKLRTGHLKGNRFRIRLRPRDGYAAPTLDELRERLAAVSLRGFPNLFGGQRFANGKTVALGLAALEGKRISQLRRLKLAISAVQSLVFNRWLALRVAASNLDSALVGDVLKKRDTGGLFVCQAPDEDTARLRAGELVVTGALPGNKLMGALGGAGAFERDALESLGLGATPFSALGKIARGTRRPALMFPMEVQVEPIPAGNSEAFAEVSFFLPKGSYATVLLNAVAGAVA